MRYLVKAKVKPGKEKPLLEAIESGRLGQGPVAGDFLWSASRAHDPFIQSADGSFGRQGQRQAKEY